MRRKMNIFCHSFTNQPDSIENQQIKTGLVILDLNSKKDVYKISKKLFMTKKKFPSTW